jgi:hypothetical protein
VRLLQEEAMNALSSNMKSIIDGITRALADCKLTGYLYGDIVKRHHVEDYYLPNVIEVIVSGSFAIDQFYQALTKYLVIEREIKNDINEYVVVVAAVNIIRFRIVPEFKAFSPPEFLSRYNVDQVYIKLDDGSVVDIKKSRNCEVIKSSKEVGHWSTEDILGFVLLKGNLPKAKIDPDDLTTLGQYNLASLKQPLESTFEEFLTELLLTKYPGTAVQFMIKTFSDAKDWLFVKLLDLMISLNVPMPEDVSPDLLLSPKKLGLLDVYSEFALYDQKAPESGETRVNRLKTSLRLMFDAPNLSIPTPYIDHVTVILAPEDEKIQIEAFQGVPDPCPYPPCECDPAECGLTGEPCCCCHSIDIVSAVQARCHRKIWASCDETGLRPGPDEPNFPDDCSRCFQTCASILCDSAGNCSPVKGQPVPSWHICTQDASDLPPWWFIQPPTPCRCDCAIQDGPTCRLWCATCDGVGAHCKSNVEVSGYDCNYVITMTPTGECCGSPAFANIYIVFDVSGSMIDERNEVVAGIANVITLLSQSGTTPAFSLLSYKDSIFTHSWDDDCNHGGSKDYCFDGTKFAAYISGMTVGGGGAEYQFRAILRALDYIMPDGRVGALLIVTDESDDGPETIEQVITKAQQKDVAIFYVGPLNGNEQQAIQTGGQFWDIHILAPGGTPNPDLWVPVFDEMAKFVSIFPTSCDCLDQRDAYLRRDLFTHPWCECPDEPPINYDCQDTLLASHPECFLFPIGIREVGDAPDSNSCDEPLVIYACGSTITVIPQYYNEVCCSDLVLENGVSLGCTCPPEPPPSCCGPHCIPICDGRGGSYYDTVEQAQEAVWQKCIEERASGHPDDPCLLMRGAGGTTWEACKVDIDRETAEWYWGCFWPVQEADWECADAKCDYPDECIVGHPNPPLSNDQCTYANNPPSGELECTSVQHPDTVVLNNGIGLVAYEAFDPSATSVIKIQQFKTSVRHKLLPNRIFNYGRLQNPGGWEADETSGLLVARLYSQDPLPTGQIQGVAPSTVDPDDTSTWKDVVAFETGPMRGQCFPLAGPAYGTDPDLGEFIRFYAPSSYVSTYPSSDDVYNVRWFIYDFHEPDTYLIGDSEEPPQDWEHEQYLFDSRETVDSILIGERITTHVYNGQPVPVAYPRIATAENYSNHIENSHHVFLAYQALEDGKWNVYIRQVRLSEYSAGKQRAEAQLVQISDLASPPSDAIYRIVCKSDNCAELSDGNTLITRSVVFSLMLPDGREILNQNFIDSGEFWDALCPGDTTENFPKDRIFAKLTHSVVANRCPDQFEIDDIFYDWRAGQEYTVSLSVNSGQSLYTSVPVPGDTAVPLGQFEDSYLVGDIEIINSTVGATWYESQASDVWRVMSDDDTSVLQEVMGLDIGEPICLTDHERGHCTRPVIKVNYNNDLFVAYENTESGVPQVHLTATAEPIDVLPAGRLNAKDLDDSLSYMIKPSDFVYQVIITNEGMNQSVDMFIDLNDVVHLTWQSNRDNRWEIYYANSNTDFYNKRITDYEGRSLRPRIEGNENGQVFIVWHDNRFGSYEIMLAYHPGYRIIPLYQQDPYLASVGNYHDGWRHSVDQIDFTMSNSTGDTQCFTDINVKFYTDRTLENWAFTVSSEDYPFAFSLPGAQVDSITTSLDGFDGWEIATNFVTDGYGDIESQYYIATSPEIDSFLDDSRMTSIVLPDISSEGDLDTISVRASNVSSDPDKASQWSPEVSISGLDGQTVTLASLGINEDYGTGRYKQIKIKFSIYATVSDSSLSASADDADLQNDNIWRNSASTVKFGKSGSDSWDAFLRFALTVPRGSQILKADLSMISSGTSADITSSWIKLLDYDSTLPFADDLSYSANIPSVASDTYYENGADVGGLDAVSLPIGGTSTGTAYDDYLRFALDIPKESVVSSANVKVIADNDFSDPNCNSEIKLIDLSNVPEFSSTTVTQNISVATGDDDMFIRAERDAFGTEYKWDWFLDWSFLKVGYSVYATYDWMFDTYVRFDISSLPAGVSIEDVKLNLYQTTSAYQSTVTINYIDENDVSAFTDPGDTTTPGPDISSMSTSGTLFATTGNQELNVTSLYNQWIADGGTGHFGLRIRMQTADRSHQFESFEVLNPPVLSVTYGVTLDISPIAGIVWSTSSPWTAGSEYTSSDIATLIQGWLDLQSSGYSNGNYVGLVLFGQAGASSNARSFEAFNIDPHTHEGTNPGAQLNVNYTVTSLNSIDPGQLWQPSGWTTDGSESVDIKNIVQQYINRVGYSPSDYMGIIIEADDATNTTKEFYSYDNGSNSATLSVTYIPNFTWNVSVTSLTVSRICLGPGDESPGSLDLKPLVRLDKAGNQMVQSPLPLEWAKNNTYFVQIYGVDDQDTEHILDNPKMSVSCGDCYEETNSWNYVSCSYQISVENIYDHTRYYEVRVRFYADSTKESPVAEFFTTNSNDLQCFTTENNEPALNYWTDRGLEVKSGRSLELLLWPQLSDTTGLVCGIPYYVELAICHRAATDDKCTLSDFFTLGPLTKWICSCESVRWDGRIEDAPQNLRELYRWKSSAVGSSDTRITETDSDNLNPIVRIRDSLNGVILYESNRVNITDVTPDPSDRDHRLYASVFSVIPAMNMYASAVESIDSPADQVVHRSDIDICSNSGCWEEDTEGNYIRTSNDPIKGTYPAFDLDRYDNIFLAVEKPYVHPENQTQCPDFLGNQQKYIIVHRCGADAALLDFSRTPEDVTEEEACYPEQIIANVYSESDAVFAQTVRMIRVKEEYVKYHVYYERQVSPVVTKCVIEFDVVGTNESVAIRVRNGENSEWGKWQPFEPTIGENTMTIQHKLTSGSGVKRVEFQVATPAGVTGSLVTYVVADYDRITYSVNFYRPQTEDAILPPALPASGWESDSNIWSTENLLATWNGMPVASMRTAQYDSSSGQIQTFDADYIYVEIIADRTYIESVKGTGPCIAPTFDFIQQGGNDQYNIPTQHVESENRDYFRGYITINKEDMGMFRDGVAYIIPHFRNDCSDLATADTSCEESSESYARDGYNLLVPGAGSQQSTQSEDIFADDRDETGQIKSKITIRPTGDDPYFVFGDPNYRFKTNE